MYNSLFELSYYSEHAAESVVRILQEKGYVFLQRGKNTRKASWMLFDSAKIL